MSADDITPPITGTDSGSGSPLIGDQTKEEHSHIPEQHQSEVSHDETHPQTEHQKKEEAAPLKIVLLGQSRTGKSSAGNTILGREEFKTSLSSRAVTTECQRAETQIDGRPVAVIDTPDFFDQACPDPGAQIQRCRDLSAPGAHVFLLVLQLGRFSDGEKEMVRQIEKKLGSGSLIMVLFTHGDELRNQTIQQFLLKTDPELRELVRQCGGRFHLFDNTVEGDRSQVTSLLEKIDSMLAVYGEDQFSREMLLRTMNQVKKEEKDGKDRKDCNIM